MSLPAETPRTLGLGTLLIVAGLMALSLIMPRVTGLHAELSEPINLLTRTINYSLAMENSREGLAVIVDLRPTDDRNKNPVADGAVIVPEQSNSPEWEKLTPLLESLEGTPVYIIFPPSGEHPAYSKLRSLGLDLWSVEMPR